MASDGDDDHDEYDGRPCEFGFNPSDEEIAATVWLLKTLDSVCARGGQNADKALYARQALARLGDHARRLHEKVHELENVLISHGFQEVEVGERIRGKDMN